MAKVGFFSRIGNLWRGFISLWISDVEKKHPEIAYENAINSMVEKYAQLKRATAALSAGATTWQPPERSQRELAQAMRTWRPRSRQTSRAGPHLGRSRSRCRPQWAS